MSHLVADKSIPFINRFLRLTIRIHDGIVCKGLDIICIPLHLIQPLFDFIPEAVNLPLRAIRQVTVAPAVGCRRRASPRGILSTGFKAKSPCHSWDYECTQADNEVQFYRIVHQMLKPIGCRVELRTTLINQAMQALWEDPGSACCRSKDLSATLGKQKPSLEVIFGGN